MTLQRVTERNQISLGGIRYPITSPVQPRLANAYAQKISIGDTTGDSQLRRSRLQLSDNRGGIGIDVVTDVEVANQVNLNRSFYSSAYLRHEGHLTLPKLATTTAASGVSGVIKVGAIAELGNAIYAAFGTSVRKYDMGGDSWGSNLATLPALATDAITLRLAGTVYMIFAHTGGTTDTTDGSSFNDRTDNVLYMTDWDDRLWGIDATGQLRYSLSIGAWTDDAQLPLPNDYVTDLFVDRDAGGEPVIFAATKIGLFAHDAANQRFIKTDVTLPYHDDAGKGVVRWRGATYYPAGLSEYEFISGATSSVRVMGPDRDDGLPSSRRGTIVGNVATHNELIALVDSSSAGADTLDIHLGDALTNADVTDPNVGVSSLLAWDSRGWQVLWESDADTEAISAAHVSHAYDTYRLWWGHNRRVNYMDLPVDIVNPNETSDFLYATSATHDYPWLVVGQETNGLALRLKIQAKDTSATETVTPYYATNFSETYTVLPAITSDGITSYDFPADVTLINPASAGSIVPTGELNYADVIDTDVAESSAPIGTEFQAIRIRLKMARGGISTLSPDVIGTTLEWRKKLPAQYAWGFEIDMSEASSGKGGLSVQERRAQIISAAASNTLLEFTFRDDTGDSRNYYVDVLEVSGLEHTGVNEGGNIQILVGES